MIEFELITSEGLVVRESVYEVLLPTRLGQIGILYGHTELISLTTEGIITIRKNILDDTSDYIHIAVAGDGVIEVHNNHVRVLAEDAVHSDDIDDQKAREAYEAAQNMVSQAKDAVSIQHAKISLDRSAVRLKLADLRRHRNRR